MKTPITHFFGIRSLKSMFGPCFVYIKAISRLYQVYIRSYIWLDSRAKKTLALILKQE